MKRFLVILPALLLLAVQNSAAQSAAEYKSAYERQVRMLGQAGVGVETILDRWAEAAPDDCDMLLPVPLHKKKQRKRGYNQSEELCKGIATVFNRPIDTTSVQRTRNTSSQTHHSRIERVENMANVFAVIQPDALTGRHVLVVDDVVTTGATIESCCKAILQVPGTTVSIVTLASASKA